MDDQVVLWEKRGADGLTRRCEVALIGEGEFELRVWEGANLIVQEPFPDEPPLLDRAAALGREAQEAHR